MFSFPNKIAVRKFVIRKNGRETAVANHLEIQYPLLKLVLGQWGTLNGLRAKKLLFIPKVKWIHACKWKALTFTESETGSIS